MRGAIFKGPGLGLAIESLPDPVPGEGEVVLRIKRCGICSSDLAMTDGSDPSMTLRPGAQLGHEFAGEVVAVGRAVARVRVGDRITALPSWGCGACPGCNEGRPFFCTSKRRAVGGFAEYGLAAERVVLPLPAGLSLDDSALIEPLAAALHGVRLAGDLTGLRVLIIGAGPIGLGAAFWACRLGAARVAVLARSPRRRGLAQTMGAHGFLIDDGAQPLEELLQQELGRAPDVVFECAGAHGTLDRAMEAVASRGTVIVLGCCNGIDMIRPARALLKEVRLQFSIAYSLDEFEAVARRIDAGHVAPSVMITGRVPLAGLPASFEALRKDRQHCKVMVEPWATLA